MPIPKTICLACGLFASAWAQAGSEPFIGPAIAVGASFAGIQSQTSSSAAYKKNIVEIANGNPAVNSGSSLQGNLLPVIDLNWQWRVAPQWVAGVGFEYEAGKRTGPDNIVSYVPLRGSQTATLSLKQHMALYGTLGRQFAPHWLLSGKLGYHQATAASRYQFSYQPTILDHQHQQRVNGVGVGLGLTRVWKDRLELQFEGEYIQLSRINHALDSTSSLSTRASMTRLNAKIGYRF